MSIMATVSLGVVGWVELRDLDWPDPEFKGWALVDLGFVAFFLGEFLVGIVRSEDRRRYLREHWFELPGLVPLYVESLSWLRAMRILRVVRVLRLLRLVHAVRRLLRGFVFARRVFRESYLGYTLLVGVLLMGATATGFWILEHGKNPGLDSFDDSLWWAISTTTTVGYGDVAPKTGLGRLLASVLMIFGIGLVGIVASTLSAALVRMGRKGEDARTEAAIRALLAEHEALLMARERGQLSFDEFERRRANLVQITTIKTE